MKQNKVFGLLIFMIFLLSCKKDVEQHQVFDEGGVLVEEYTRNIKTFAKEGLYTRFYNDGKTPAEQVTFAKDTMNGWWIFYYENGDTSRISKVVNGVLEGVHKEFHPNGEVSQVYNHVNGEIVGLFKEYFESGALKGEIQFEDNNENGPFVEYHENGKKAWQGTYLNGKEDGGIQKFDENGVLIRKLNCVVGRCETTWKKEGVEDE